MPTVQKDVHLTPEEYLEGEQYSPMRHEFVGGRLYGMVGASRAHNLIAGNVHGQLRSHLRAQGCQVFISDMKVRVGNDFFYPDLVVECQPRDPDPYYCREPRLIVEILSESTAKWDTTTKRGAYQTLESLQEYMLIAQESKRVQVYRRSADGWDLETYGEGDDVHLSSVGLSLPLEAVYEAVL